MHSAAVDVTLAIDMLLTQYLSFRNQVALSSVNRPLREALSFQAWCRFANRGEKANSLTWVYASQQSQTNQEFAEKVAKLVLRRCKDDRTFSLSESLPKQLWKMKHIVFHLFSLLQQRPVTELPSDEQSLEEQAVSCFFLRHVDAEAEAAAHREGVWKGEGCYMDVVKLALWTCPEMGYLLPAAVLVHPDLAEIRQHPDFCSACLPNLLDHQWDENVSWGTRELWDDPTFVMGLLNKGADVLRVMARSGATVRADDTVANLARKFHPGYMLDENPVAIVGR
jgi:hypothetical protein